MISRIWCIELDLTYDEFMDVLDIKYTSSTPIGYLPPPGRYEISDLSLMINSSLPNKIEANNTIDDIRLRSNLSNKKQ